MGIKPNNVLSVVKLTRPITVKVLHSGEWIEKNTK